MGRPSTDWAGKAAIVAFGLAFSAPTLALAQNRAVEQTLPTASQMSPNTNTAARPRSPTTDFFSGPALERCPFHVDDAKYSFKLTGVIVDYQSRTTNTRQLSRGLTEASYEAFKNKTISPADICLIRDNLQKALFREGIFARVLIYDQTITGGVVRFTVIEAQIVHVRYQGAPIGPAQELVEGYLNHLAHEPFDLFRVQRYLLLANDIPGVKALASVSRSTDPQAAPGSMDLVVDLSRTPVQEVAAAENFSAKSLGPWSGVVRLDMNSFTAFGDHTTLIGYSSLGNETQQVFQAIEEVRLGNNGLYAQASFAYGHSRPGDVLAPANLRGSSYVGSMQLADPLLYELHRKVLLSGGFDIVEQQTLFPGGGALTDDHLRVLWAKLDLNADQMVVAESNAIGRLLGSNITVSGSSEFEVREGLGGLGASPHGAPALSRPSGRSDALVVRASGASSIGFLPLAHGAPPVTLTLRYQSQWADRPLLSYEEMPIGNLTIGYGYDPAAVSGDRVIAGEALIAVGPVPVALSHSEVRWTFKPFAFFDDAYVNNLDPGSQDVTVRSVGGGVEFGLLNRYHGYNVKAVLRYAKPLDKTFITAVAKPPERVLFQIIILH